MKYGNYEYYDLPSSYRSQAKCGICENIKYTDTKTDYYGKTRYLCKECRDYHKLDDNICNRVLIAPTNYKKLGSYTPSGCYITTIVCNVLGYNDDCELLKTIRGFRDTYLKQNVEYLPLLMEYDKIGPLISEAIINEVNNDILCAGIFNHFLVPCVDYIKNQDYENAINCYKNMVLHLEETLNIPEVMIDVNSEYNLEDLGKGRIRNIKTSEI